MVEMVPPSRLPLGSIDRKKIVRFVVLSFQICFLLQNKHPFFYMIRFYHFAVLSLVL